jgi:integrase
MTTRSISPLRQRMIEDMNARQLGPHTQRSHISSRERFAAFLKRSPDTATADDVRRFRLHLMASGASISNRNRIMTGVNFLLRVTLRRLDLAAEIYHLKEPQRLPLVMSPEEAKRLLAMADTSKVHALLALGYGCGLRAGEVVRLGVGDLDSAQNIIRVVQAKGARTATSCCRPRCSVCCASGGRSARRATTRACRRSSAGPPPASPPRAPSRPIDSRPHLPNHHSTTSAALRPDHSPILVARRDHSPRPNAPPPPSPPTSNLHSTARPHRARHTPAISWLGACRTPPAAPSTRPRHRAGVRLTCTEAVVAGSHNRPPNLPTTTAAMSTRGGAKIERTPSGLG